MRLLWPRWTQWHILTQLCFLPVYVDPWPLTPDCRPLDAESESVAECNERKSNSSTCQTEGRRVQTDWWFPERDASCDAKLAAGLLTISTIENVNIYKCKYIHFCKYIYTYRYMHPWDCHRSSCKCFNIINIKYLAFNFLVNHII